MLISKWWRHYTQLISKEMLQLNLPFHSQTKCSLTASICDVLLYRVWETQGSFCDFSIWYKLWNKPQQCSTSLFPCFGMGKITKFIFGFVEWNVSWLYYNLSCQSILRVFIFDIHFCNVHHFANELLKANYWCTSNNIEYNHIITQEHSHAASTLTAFMSAYHGNLCTFDAAQWMSIYIHSLWSQYILSTITFFMASSFSSMICSLSLGGSSWSYHNNDNGTAPLLQLHRAYHDGAMKIPCSRHHSMLTTLQYNLLEWKSTFDTFCFTLHYLDPPTRVFRVDRLAYFCTKQALSLEVNFDHLWPPDSGSGGSPLQTDSAFLFITNFLRWFFEV